VECGVDTVR